MYIKDFSFIKFEEDKHRYFNANTGQYIPSVTSVLSKLSTFDKEYWLKVKAKQNNTTVEELEKQWDHSRDTAAKKGKDFHAHMEDYICGKAKKGIYSNADKYFEDYSKDVHVSTEVVIGNHLVAGTFDCLAVRDGSYILKDWKTNEKFTTYSTYKLEPPFQYLDNSKYTIYAFQLSLYRYLLDMPVYKMEVVHFDDNSYTVHEVPYLEREVRMLLNKLENDNRSTHSGITGIDPSVF